MPSHRSSRSRRAASTLLGAVAAVLVSGCQATTRVTVSVGRAGDGDVAVTLTLDRQAAAQFPNLASQLRVTDLQKSGWKLTGPGTAPDGTVSVTVDHRFRDGAEEAEVVGELTGPNGPFRALRIERQVGFARTRTVFDGTVDLRRGVDAFADAGLGAKLDGGSLSQALAVLRNGGADPGLTLEVATRLPGHVARANTSNREGGAPVWKLPLGQLVTVRAEATERNWFNLGLAGVSVLSLVGLVIVGLHRLGLGLGLGDDRWERRAKRRRRDTWRISERRRRW